MKVTVQERQQQIRAFVLSCSCITVVQDILRSTTKRGTGTGLCEYVRYELETAAHDVVSGKVYYCSEFSLNSTPSLNP